MHERSGCVNRIADLRKKAGLTQKELAEQLNINSITLSRYETGDRQPSFETVSRLSEIFECSSTKYIMGFDTTKGENEVTVSKSEYEYLKEIERKYNEIKALVAD